MKSTDNISSTERLGSNHGRTRQPTDTRLMDTVPDRLSPHPRRHCFCPRVYCICIASVLVTSELELVFKVCSVPPLT
jgi:hypothetical protein